MQSSFAVLFNIDIFISQIILSRSPKLLGLFMAVVFHCFHTYFSNCGPAFVGAMALTASTMDPPVVIAIQA